MVVGAVLVAARCVRKFFGLRRADYKFAAITFVCGCNNTTDQPKRPAADDKAKDAKVKPMDRPFMEHPSGDFETPVDAMADAITKAMVAPEFNAQFQKLVGSPVVVNRPEQMLEVAKKEAALIERIVKTAGIKLE